MVAPFLAAISGVVTALTTSAAAKAIKDKVAKYAVVRMDKHGAVVGRPFASLDNAKAWQKELAAKGCGSIIVQKEGESYSSLNPVQGMTPSGQIVPGDEIRKNRGFATMIRPYHRPSQVGKAGGDRQFATNEEQQKEVLITTRFPTPERAIYEQYGPFPATPPFFLSPSAHDWKSDVQSREVPPRFFSGRQFIGQPSEMVVR